VLFLGFPAVFAAPFMAKLYRLAGIGDANDEGIGK
jgi:hypothetical protein